MPRSVRIHAFGGPEELRIEEIAQPQPAAGEVALRVRAIGVNRTEITLRTGRSPSKPTLPTLIGFEAAGEILALGAGVTGFAIGDRVALAPAYSAAQYGLYGEVSLAPARSLVAMPSTMSFEEAAAAWVSFGTAWSGLVSLGGLAAGQTVLLPAASSSVGLSAIQVARRLGARPIALTRTRQKADALIGHGAAAVIVTEEQDVAQEVSRLTSGRGADLVFDPVGGPTFATLAESTAVGGMLILYGALSHDPTVIPPFALFGRDLTVRGLALTAVTRDDAKLEALKRFVSSGLADGSLKPVIERTFAFDEIAEAHRFVEANGHVGKVVVTV